MSYASFEIVEASGGIQRLQLAQELEPDLVLLDVKMPDPDGMEVLRRIRSQEAAKLLPVIFLMGDALEIDNAVSTWDSDPSDFITKTISSQELVARIRWLLRREMHSLGR